MCGDNSHSQLGIKSERSVVPTWTPVSFCKETDGLGMKCVCIAAGALHSLFVDDAGNWYGCGWNGNGQVGDVDGSSSAIHLIETDSAVAQTAASTWLS